MGSGSDYIQVPVAQLHEINSSLTALKSDLDGAEALANMLDSVDDIHGARVQTAVNEFFQEWKKSRRTLIENVGVLGDVSGKIAEATTSFDDEVASNVDKFTAQLKGRGE